MRTGIWLETLWQDVRYAARQLRKNPGFTTVAVLTLALGIGATTAMFTIVHSVLLRPLPYPDAQRIMRIYQSSASMSQMPFSPPNYADFRDQARSFSSFGACTNGTVTLIGDGDPERLVAVHSTEPFLRALGVRPHLGRLLSAEDEARGTPLVALIGHGLWHRRFGADPAAVGRTLNINDKLHTIVGVLPPGVEYPVAGDVWLPMRFEPEEMEQRLSLYLDVVARLAPGVSVSQAQAELATIAKRLEPLSKMKGFGARIVPLHEVIVGDVRPMLLLLLCAVGFVWLIACANVANLMLSRAAGRERELAVRAALGAGRARLAGQLLTESTLLALLGGAAGLAIGRWCLAILVAARPQHLPRLAEIGLDPYVFTFAAVLSVLTGLLFGMTPALRAARPDWGASLKSGAQTSAAPHSRLRGALVVIQLSLSLVLLAGAGLMLRTTWNLLASPAGFDPHNILTAEIVLPPLKYADSVQRAAFMDGVLGHLRTRPEVESAAVTNYLPLGRQGMQHGIEVGDRPENSTPSAEPFAANFRTVSSDYFHAMRIPLQAGRGIEEGDRAGAPEVVVINEAMARRFWPGRNPIGQRIRIKRRSEPEWRQIVGIVGNVRHEGLNQEPRPEMYVPFAQQPFQWFRLVVRSTGDPTALVQELRQAVWAVDSNLPVSGLRTMDDVVAASTGETRFYGVLLGAFAVVALGLAGVGLFGVMSYAVASRTREIGIRLALGAERSAIFRLVLGRGARLTLAGIVFGLGGAIAATRGLEKLLYGVQPADPVTLASVAAVLALVALLACWLPARRATRVDPVLALRHE